MSFDDFQEVLDKTLANLKRPKISVRNDLVPDMKHLIIKSIESVKNKLNPK